MLPDARSNVKHSAPKTPGRSPLGIESLNNGFLQVGKVLGQPVAYPLRPLTAGKSCINVIEDRIAIPDTVNDIVGAGL